MTLNPYSNPSPYSNGTTYVRDGETDHGYDVHRDGSDDNMERIRDLILGDLRRSWDARLHTLETRLQMLEDKLDALRHETQSARDEHMSALATGIDELGQHVRRLGRP